MAHVRRIAHPRQSLLSIAGERLAVDVLMIPTGYASRMLEGINRYTRTHGRWRLRWRDVSKPGWEQTIATDGAPAVGTISCLEPSKISAAVPLLRHPLVSIHEVATHGRIPVVTFEEATIGRTGARFLIERGFRDLTFFGSNDNWSRTREQAFFDEVARHGYRGIHQPYRSRPPRWNSDPDKRHLDAYLQQLPRPTGAMASCDTTGRLLVEAAENLGLRVPQELAVLAVDNDELMCESTRVTLSSIETDIEGLGYNLARMLDDLLKGKQPPVEPLRLPPRRVVARESTDIIVCDNPTLSVALSYMAAHVEDGITREDIAAQVGASLSTLERLFRVHLNRSPGAELRRLRLERTCALLTTTDLSLADIADRSGMGSASSLVQAFRRALQMTPGEYRSRHQS